MNTDVAERLKIYKRQMAVGDILTLLGWIVVGIGWFGVTFYQVIWALF